MTHHDLNSEVRGPSEGLPILLLHGWGSSAQSVRPLAEALADSYRTHALDLPGHGRSPPPPSPWGVPDHADVIHSYVDDEIQRPVTLLGHSNGGRISLYMAGTPAHAGCVERLVLISPSGVRPERSWAYYLRSGLARALRAPVNRLPAPLHTPALDWLRHSLAWRLLGSTDYNQLTGVMRETFVKTVNHYLDRALERIQVPTLLFWGTDDGAVPRRQMSIIEDTIPDCGLVELEGAGHYGHLDTFDTVVSGTRHFLEQT